MLLSRIQVNSWARREIVKKTTCTIIPKSVFALRPSFVNANPSRSIKTFSAHLTQEVSNVSKVPSLIDKSIATDIPISHISREQTAQLYLDNVFPLRMGVLDIRQLVFRNSKTFLETKAHQAIPSEELPHNFAIKQIFARTKDGGAIVKFSFKSTDESKVEVAKDIVARINDHIRTHNIVAPFNFQSVRAFLVKGEPFMEDILARYPTQRLRVEFQGEAVNVERLYQHLRPYGKIFDIALYPNPIKAKDPARYAIVQFTRVRSATSARNCLHGHIVDGTRLNVLYERQLRTNVVKDWIIEHPRITIPIFAAIVAGITYAVFDPIRVFFITSKVTQRFNPEEYAIYRWLRNETWAHFMPSTSSKSYLNPSGYSVWADDAEKTDKLISYLAETPETFVLVTGHQGSGKSSMVKSVLKDRKNTLFIDCEDVGQSSHQSEMIKDLAKEVGYFPVFTWISSISGLVDTVVTATTGQKAGFTTSVDAQIRAILETVAIALGEIVPSEKEARRRATEDAERENIMSRIKSLILGHKAQKYEYHEKSDDENSDVKNIPIVVIDNFMYRETAKNTMLWDELADWAALLIENEIAHVVFVSSNAGVMKVLGKALPGRSFSTVALSDAPPEMAMSFINKQLGSDIQDPDLHDVVAALGGRLTELEMLVQKMKVNMDAKSAFEDIVSRNLIDIRKYGFGDSYDVDTKLEWTPTQFWTIVKLLTNKMSINYDELRWSPVFGGSEGPLKAMERAELIIISQKEGRAHSIRPGKPVYYTVFNRLISDTIFAASMEVESNTVLKKQSETDMAKLEDIISKLTNINNGNRPPREIENRIKFLLTKVASTQKLIEEYDANIKAAKELISKAWVEELED